MNYTPKTFISMTRVSCMVDHMYSAYHADLENIMHDEFPRYYNAGVYGWNCDVYVIMHHGELIGISTGYRNTRGPKIPNGIISKYDTQAANLRDEYRVIHNDDELVNYHNKFYDLVHAMIDELITTR